MNHTAVKAEPAPLRVLIVEDSEEDADLIVLELKRGGYEPVYRRVETSETMQRGLQDSEWDVDLFDFSMPEFSVVEALQVVKEKNPDLPFVIVPATIRQKAGVE